MCKNVRGRKLYETARVRDLAVRLLLVSLLMTMCTPIVDVFFVVHHSLSRRLSLYVHALTYAQALLQGLAEAPL